MRSDSSYIDIGFWVGPTLLYGCQLAKCASGIEPDPIAYKELVANVALNGSLAPNIRLFNVCVATNIGQVKFASRKEGRDFMSSLLFSDCKKARTVPSLTFDDLIRRNEVTKCWFNRMDIEGGEYEMLPTILTYLRKHRPKLYLSLHPDNLIPTEGNGTFVKCCRGIISFVTTLRKLGNIRFYRHFYDCHGALLTFFRGCCGFPAAVPQL
jgi:FkbM family methyltransferase